MTTVPILLYHSVDAQSSPRFRPWTVTPQELAAHFEVIEREGYHPTTVGQLEHLRSIGRSPPERTVVITFDDGFEDFHTRALPILAEHRFASTLYVTTGYLGGRAGWLARDGEADRRMLSTSQLEETAAAGVEIGAHSHSHPRLDELRPSESMREIQESKLTLEDLLQRPVTTFAYPHGYHGPRVRQQVIASGFRSAAAVKHAMSSDADDMYALARVVVPRGVSGPQLSTLLRGVSLRTAPFRTSWCTICWRAARRSRAELARTIHAGARR